MLAFAGDDAVGDELCVGREDIDIEVGDMFVCEGGKDRYCEGHEVAKGSAVGRYVLLTGGGSTLD